MISSKKILTEKQIKNSKYFDYDIKILSNYLNTKSSTPTNMIAANANRILNVSKYNSIFYPREIK